MPAQSSFGTLVRLILVICFGLAGLAVTATSAGAAPRHATPTGLHVVRVTSSSITLRWKAHHAKAFRVQYSTRPSMRHAHYRRFAARTGTLRGLAAHQRYYFRVRVVAPHSRAALSRYTRKRTHSVMTRRAQGAPRLRVSASATSTTVTARWSLNPGDQPVQGIIVSRIGGSSGAYQSPVLPATTTSKTLTNLSPGTAYTLQVAPVVDGVTGAAVSTTVQTTVPGPVPAPAGKVLMGAWDTSSLRLGAAGLSNYQANKGIDDAMAAVRGTTDPTNIMKAYDSVWDTSYATSGVAKSAQFGHAFAITMPAPGGGGNTGYQSILDGKQDAAIDAFFNSIPTTETAYVMLQNEADNVTALGTDPALYDQALGYLINRAAPIYARRGLNGAVGPVFMAGQFKTDPAGHFNTWNFIKYVNDSAKPYTFYGLDCYSKYTNATATTYESIPAIVDLAFSRARALGITRFAIPEYANSLEWRNHDGQIVGTRTTQQNWIKTEIPKIEAIPGLQFAIYFHKPTGPESKNAQLLDADGATPFTTFADML